MLIGPSDPNDPQMSARDRGLLRGINPLPTIGLLPAVAIALLGSLFFAWVSPVAAQSTSGTAGFSHLMDQASWLWIAIPLVVGLLVAQSRTVRLLRAANAHNFALVRNASDAILLVDYQGIIVRANNAATSLLGYSREELEKQPIETVLPERYRTRHVEYRNQFLSGRLAAAKGVGRTLQFLTKDGREVEAEVTLGLAGEGKQAIGTAIVRDVTERIAIQTRLQQAIEASQEAAKAKSEFLANMSHEIRTPLSGVLGTLHLLAQDDITDEQRELVRVADASGRMLMNIINDILDYSKLEEGRVEITESVFCLQDVIYEVYALMRAGAKEKEIEFEYNIESGERVWLRGDEARIRQLLFNLIGNAIKFTHSGSVKLDVIPEPDHEGGATVLFSVRDTGIGISAANLKRLFGRFERVHTDVASKYGGSGLGLSICKQIVSLMGGQIDCTSEFGKGSHFWVRLPLETATEPAAGSDRPAEKGAHPVLSRRILLAEDNEVNRMLIMRLLGTAGHKVVAAKDGLEAISMLADPHIVAKRPFDLVLMDLQMPNMDGLEAARQIRARSDSLSTIPIIALTANKVDELTEEFTAARFDGFVGKPIEPDRLFGEIARVTADDFENLKPNRLTASAAS